MLEKDLQDEGVTDLTSKYGDRLVEQERCAYLRPVIAHADSPDREIVKKEYMFPFATVVQCPQSQMLRVCGAGNVIVVTPGRPLASLLSNRPAGHRAQLNNHHWVRCF